MTDRANQLRQNATAMRRNSLLGERTGSTRRFSIVNDSRRGSLVRSKESLATFTRRDSLIHIPRPKDTNHCMLQFFEWRVVSDHKHWQRLAQEIPNLVKLGFHGIWIPPPSKGTSGEDVGYAAYDLFDLGEFDQKGSVATKWGTKEELHKAMAVAQQYNVQIYADAVLNHKMGADEKETFRAVEVDANNRTKETSEPYDITAWTKFTFPGRKGKYSQFEWNFQHFSGTDYNAATEKNTIYRIVGDNKGWASGVDTSENANFDFLMGCDIDYGHPDVVDEVKRWADWIVGELGLSGFRMDALKHIEVSFIKELADFIRKDCGYPDFFMVGEYWKDDMSTLTNYLNETNYSVSLFDVPLHSHFRDASLKPEEYDISKIFNDTLTQKHPVQSVTFVDNHDSQPGAACESWVLDWFKPIAYALILLRLDGYPCVFYGDYYGVNAKEDDPENVPAVPGKQQMLDRMLNARLLFSYGTQEDYFDDPHTIGWVRKGDPQSSHATQKKGLAVVVCSLEAGEKRMNVGADKKGQQWRDLMGGVTDLVTIDDEGFGTFKANAGSVAVWADHHSSQSQ